MSEQDLNNRAHTWKPIAAFFSFVFGIFAALSGGVLTAITWIIGTETHPLLHGLGTVLIALLIPLMILSACLLDSSEKKAKPPSSQGWQTGDRGAAGLSHMISLAVAFTVLCFTATIGRAQQTIFNVPTTDVLDRGKVYAELDVSFKPNNSQALTRFSSFVPRIVVGAGHQIEVGLNITGNIQPGADTTTLVPTAKWRLYQGKDNGAAIVVGDNLFIPVRNRIYNAGNYFYAEVSKSFRSGTRLTAGGYDFTRNVVAAVNRPGGQFGCEQTISKRVAFAADYFTGNHAAGYFTPGVVFKAGPKVTGYAGYSIGNQSPSRGNHFFLLELGYNFK